MFSALFELMGMMFILFGIGLLLRKKGMITDAGKKCLTDVIMMVIIPCNIIKAFTSSLDGVELSSFAVAFGVAIVAQLFYLLLASTLFRKFEAGERAVYQYGTVCSNSGFMGNPLAEGVFGSIGLTYAAVYLLPQRIVMWTAGVSYFSKETNKKEVYKKILTHPAMFATYVGLILMIFSLELPSVLSTTITSCSNSCTALTMIYIGTILGDVNFKSLVSKKLLGFCGLRLIGIPLVVYIGCLLAGIDPLVTGVSVLLAATPAGSTTSLLASQYGADESTAAKIVVLSTICCIITIPVWSVILLAGIA